jgi:hypothetical protein
MEVILKDVRLSFPDLWKPGNPPPGSASGPKFGAQFIFEKGSPAFLALEAAVKKCATDKWGANGMTVLKALPKDKLCLRDGNLNLAKDGSVRDGYVDMFYTVARNKVKPVVVDRNHKVPLTEESGRPYGGCYVNAKIDVYAMDKPGQGKSINATLMAVQWVRDGDSFGGARPSADGFEDMGDVEGEDNGDLF